MEIRRSDRRTAKPVEFTIADGVTLASTGAVYMHIPLLVKTHFFPSSFKLQMNGRIIYVDPIIVEDKEPADFILITHAHEDHFSMADIKRLLKPGTTVICPAQVTRKLAPALEGHALANASPGDHLDSDGLLIEAVGAYNVKSGLFTPHSERSGYVGYVVTSGGSTVYHAGDTDYTAEMQQLSGLTAALVPIDGGKLTMTTEKAAEFINHVKPRFVVPMHYRIGTAAVAKFRGLVGAHTQVIVMDGQ